MSGAFLLALAALASPAQERIHGAHQIFEFSILGRNVGGSGLVQVMVANQPEISAGGSTADFGLNDFWYTLRRNPGTGAWEHVHASPVVPGGIVRLDAGPLMPFIGDTIVLLRGDGMVELHDPYYKTPIGSFASGLTAPTALTLADLDGNGYEEILVADATSVRIFDVGGSQLGACNAGGSDLIAAQMDGDAAIEIAVTSGVVFDGASLTAQWTRAGGFGVEVEAADVDGDGRAELFAMEDWSAVHCFDVEVQAVKWTLPRFDNDALRLTDLEGDGAWEMLVGDGQWGAVNVHEALTGAFRSAIAHPDHGVTDVLALDADGDGDLELAWGGGWSSTGDDHLTVADWQTGATQWRSEQLDGPFVGPLVGDLNGDGRPEIVLACARSNAGAQPGRVLVLDAQFFTLRAISEPIAGGLALDAIHDLALADVDGDRDLEIAVAADRASAGTIVIYDFARGRLTPIWTNGDAPPGEPFHSVALHDFDGDGHLEVLAGGGRWDGSAVGTFVHVYDAASRREIWRSGQLGGYWDRVGELIVADADMDGEEEVIAQIEGGDLYLMDPRRSQLESVVDGEFTAIAMHEHQGMLHLMAADRLGRLVALQWMGMDFMPMKHWNVATAPVDGMSITHHGHALIGAGGRVRMIMLEDGMMMWESADFGAPFGATVPLRMGSLDLFLTAGRHAMVLFGH